MKVRNIIWRIAIALMVIPLCTACDDEDDVTLNSKYYLSTTVYPSDSYRAFVSLRLKDNSVTINTLEPEYRFIAGSTRQVLQDIQLCVSNGNELIESYNAINGTDYNVLPVENYSFNNDKVTIKSGESTSKDTISISLKDVEKLTKEGGYLLPVKVVSIEGGDLNAMSSNRSIVYVKVDNVRINVETAQPTEGAIIANRSEWTLKVAPTMVGDVNRLIDGSNTDVTNGGGYKEFWITVDLKKVQTLTGIKAQCWGAGYAPSAVEVYTSEDGVKWKSMGTAATSGSVQYIKFTNAVETRYLKYYVNKGSNTVSLTEFNLYAK